MSRVQRGRGNRGTAVSGRGRRALRELRGSDRTDRHRPDRPRAQEPARRRTRAAWRHQRRAGAGCGAHAPAPPRDRQACGPGALEARQVITTSGSRRRRLIIALVVGLLCRPGAMRAATLTVEAPPSLAGAAARVSSVNLPQLENTLARAGLDVPDRIAIVLVAEDDPRARSTPSWIVGYASGERDITILPDRVLSYPYDSLESVVRHEIVHLALTTTARG